MPKKVKSPPRVVIFAGPNGAGKSTHADAILAALGIETFVNADYIARGLSGRNTDAVNFEAGRIMLKRLRQLADAGADFAFESTLSSRTFAPFLRGLKAQGYSVAIYYFALTNAQLAVRRVKLRVALGGHHVPSDVVKRRFARSLQRDTTEAKESFAGGSWPEAKSPSGHSFSLSSCALTAMLYPKHHEIKSNDNDSKATKCS